MSDMLIAAPLWLEARLISSARPPARVLRTGMGPRRSRAAVSLLREDPAETLIVMGFGGGLAHDCRAGEVVVGESVRGPLGAPIPCAGACSLAAALERAGLPVRCGPIESVTRVAMGAKRVALRARGAIAVDMESAWLAPAARGRPFIVVRVLSDTPSQELTHPLAMAAGVARACTMLRRVAAALHEWTSGE